MVQTLYTVVSARAKITHRTLVTFRKPAKFRRVELVIPPSVLDAVVEVASFVVVGQISPRAFEGLELTEK